MILPDAPSDAPSLAGRLLVAMPGIDDPRFVQAVILVCAHDADHAMGLRIDQPAPDVDLAGVLAAMDMPAPQAGSPRPVLMGGPVERQRGFVLHSDDWMAADASVAFGEGLALTGTREALSAMSGPGAGPRRALLALGYAGWGEGQLESELADNVWLTADGDPELIFGVDHETKWSRALARIGVDAARLSAQGGRA